MPSPISMTRFCRYVVSSMKCAKSQMIASVVGIAAAAKMNGTRNASVPKTKSEDQQRDRDRDQELADLQVVREDGVEVVLDRGLAGDVDRLGARDRADGAAHVVRVALGVGRLEVGDDRGDDDLVGHGLDAGELARRQLLRRRLGTLTAVGRSAAADPGSRP